MELVDTHAHLEDIKDLEGAVRRAADVGVIAIIAVGSDYDSNFWILSESRRYEVENLKIYPALGLHPWDFNRIDDTIRFIEKNISKAVALGEVGLDYWYKDVGKSDEKKRLQREV
jgi:TatD DNase family protein